MLVPLLSSFVHWDNNHAAFVSNITTYSMIICQQCILVKVWLQCVTHTRCGPNSTMMRFSVMHFAFQHNRRPLIEVIFCNHPWTAETISNCSQLEYGVKMPRKAFIGPNQWMMMNERAFWDLFTLTWLYGQTTYWKQPCECTWYCNCKQTTATPMQAGTRMLQCMLL